MAAKKPHRPRRRGQRAGRKRAPNATNEPAAPHIEPTQSPSSSATTDSDSSSSTASDEPSSVSVGLPRQPLQPTDWRIGLLVVLVCCAVYLPTLGKYGMYDPWETIYTEVARQFMERDDWMSPYWHNGTGPEGWAETNFWSKPVGSFWLSGLSLKLFGWEDTITLRQTGRTLADPALTSSTGGGPDPGEVLATQEVEWAVRAPFFLVGLFGIFCVYLLCSRLFSRRAGVLAAIVLATSPMYFFISRQAMTDMPYVGLFSGGLALFALAVFGEKELLPRKQATVAGWRISWPHAWSYYAFVATFLLCLGLMFSVLVPPLIRLPIPGLPTVSRAVWLVIYAITALAFVVLSLQTRTKNEVYLYTFYLVTAMAGLAKGLIGALQPGFVIFLYLVMSREWRMLTEVALTRGVLVAVTIFAPWWHAMVLKHGVSFWNELVGTEQMRRLTVGEQKQAKGTWEYYIQQIGYGFFPWIAFIPGALARAFGSSTRPTGRARDAQARARLFCSIWFAATLLLFTLTLTKYHHYILPVIPPAAILVGIYLDDLLARRTRGALVPLLAAAVIILVVAVDLYTQPANWVWMFTYLYSPNWARGVPDGLPILIYAALSFAMIALLTWSRIRHYALYGLLVVAVGVGGYVLNTYQTHCSHHWGQKYVMQTYYKLRKGPEEQLVAWQFNWRGETWYTAAQVVVSKSLKNEKIKAWLKERKGRRFFFITERSRYPSLRSMLPTAKGRDTLRIVDDNNVHFILAEATI